MTSMQVKVAVITKFAAGNIYIGQFDKVSGVGAELDWGEPFTSRPLALRGYYKYQPKAIDMAESPYTGKKGELALMYFVNGVIDELLATGQYREWFDYYEARVAELGL